MSASMFASASASAGPQRAAVLGDPVEHSRSPILHNAGYEAAGLAGWHYEKIRCTAEQLPELVDARGEEFSGFSVTMPGKFAALAYADETTDRAAAIGSANTLVNLGQGRWRADNTDCDGVVGALAEAGATAGVLAGGRAVVVGAGGTARPAIWALSELGIRHLTVIARSDRGLAVKNLAEQCGMTFELVLFDEGGQRLAEICAAADALVSTVPSAALEPVCSVADGSEMNYAQILALAPRIVDVIYDPWPTPLFTAAQTHGHSAVGGLSMLLHQAFGQFEQFTHRPAPREAMRRALLG